VHELCAVCVSFTATLTILCVCVFVGKGEAIETTLAALQVVPEPFRSFANTLVDICAYAGRSPRPPVTPTSALIGSSGF